MPRRSSPKFIPSRPDELRSKWDRLLGGKKETAVAGRWTKNDAQETEAALDVAMKEDFKRW